MKSLDLRSEPAIKLLAEFLDMDTPYLVGSPDEPSCPRFHNAEHFAHGENEQLALTSLGGSFLISR